MAERSCFRVPFGSERGKWHQTVLESARQHFYGTFPLISKKLKCLSCLLVGSEILGPSSNMLTDDQKCSCHNLEKIQEQVQPQFSSKRKTFFASFIDF